MKLSLDRIFELLDTKATGPGARGARRAHQLSIALGVTAMVVCTDPGVHATTGRALDLIFWIVAAMFAVEYAVRLMIVPWANSADKGHRWRARRHWAASFNGLIDAAGMLPLLAIASGMDSGPARLFGALWLIKLAPYAEALELVARVFKAARGPLTSLLLGFLMVLIAAATLAYVFESGAQPKTFGSIPLALWWAITTLTTTGYGDAVPITLAGRILGGAVMLAGIGVLAMWAGILATTFSDEMRRRDFLRTWELVSRVSFFEDLGADLIAEVARLLKPRKLPAGAIVMRAGQPGDCMFFVVTGEVSVQLPAGPLTLGDGAFIGEMALITGAPRSATVVAQTDCELLALDLADFRDLAARHADLTSAIVGEARRRSGAPPKTEPEPMPG